MKNSILLIILSTIFFTQCKYPASHSTLVTVNFTPDDTVKLLGDKIISTAHYERDFALSPDGEELFYTSVSPKNRFSTILQMKWQNKQWSTPEIAPFSGKYSDLEPAYHPNGQKLFFASNRPLDEGDSIKQDFDIWYVEKDQEGHWANCYRLNDSINSSTNEFYPSIANSGNLYFTASYPQGKGKEDIFMSPWNGEKYINPISLDSVNTALYEFNAFISPSEDFIIFSSFGREDGLGGGDLYISYNQNGEWTSGKHLGKKINSSFLDYSPFYDASSSTLFFSSEKNQILKQQVSTLNYQQWSDMLEHALNGNGNIFYISFDPEVY